MQHILRHSRRGGIAITGSIVVLIGLVLVPYPGPGWLIVFAGLAILATEFKFAARWLKAVRARYETWKAWLFRQRRITQVASVALTGLIVLLTLWLLNTFALIDHFLTVDLEWLRSPFFRN